MVAVVGCKFDHTKGMAIQEKGREDRVPYTQSNQDKVKIKNPNSDRNQVERISRESISRRRQEYRSIQQELELSAQTYPYSILELNIVVKILLLTNP